MKSKYIKGTVCGLEVVVLTIGESECRIAPGLGANLIYFGHKKRTVIGYDEEVLSRREYTGTPVLFPTPNRVRDCVAYYNGVQIKQHKNGEEIFCHGLVHNEPFILEDIVSDNEYISASFSYTFSPENPYYSSFPFSCKLRLIYTLEEGRLTAKYELENNGDVKIPFGFGLHPYFYYEKDAILSLPADYYLLTDNMLPTGDLIKTEESFVGLSKDGASMDKTELDCDFLRRIGENAHLYYPDSGMTVDIEATEDFRHYVVYSPKGENLVCVEPQTCSIDAHNLYEKGFKHSGLLFAPPKETVGGYARFTVKNI